MSPHQLPLDSSGLSPRQAPLCPGALCGQAWRSQGRRQAGRGGGETRQGGLPPPAWLSSTPTGLLGTYIKETQKQMLSAPLCDPKGNGL